jgi:hypothetical protein
MGLTVGSLHALTGNVTTLNWIGARTARDIERALGYGAGRLSHGYWIALLKDTLVPQDFEFDGTTLRSGGRLGLPGTSENADQARKRVHDQIRDEYGPDGYKQLQQAALASARTSGGDRIAKVVPAQSHNPAMAPNLQYPMGGGGLQWKIVPPGKRFLIALHVDAKGLATSPRFTADIGPGAPYDNRARVMSYLRTA